MRPNSTPMPGAVQSTPVKFVPVMVTVIPAGPLLGLMLVMFGVGMGSLAAMLALGALTAVERNLPRGRRLTRPIGVALILLAVYSVASAG